MRLLSLLIIFFFPVNICFAQEAIPEAEGMVDVNDSSNFKNENIKNIVELPVQEIGPDASILAKSLFQITLGPSFYRFDPYDANENTISSFSKTGYSLQLRAQYYMKPFFSILMDTDFQKLESERYDGKSLVNEETEHKTISFGIQFDLNGFILAGLKSYRTFPFYFLNNDNALNENQITDEAISYKIGHRTGVSNLIIELFYYYHDVSESEVSSIGKISGKAQSIGIEVFTKNKKTFGIKLAETFGEYHYETGEYHFRNLVIQPFYRF